MNYYDSILLLVPSLIVAGGAVSLMTEISTQVAIIASAIISVAVVGHGMFINPPVSSSIEAVTPDSNPENQKKIGKTTGASDE